MDTIQRIRRQIELALGDKKLSVTQKMGLRAAGLCLTLDWEAAEQVIAAAKIPESEWEKAHQGILDY